MTSPKTNGKVIFPRSPFYQFIEDHPRNASTIYFLYHHLVMQAHWQVQPFEYAPSVTVEQGQLITTWKELVHILPFSVKIFRNTTGVNL